MIKRSLVMMIGWLLAGVVFAGDGIVVRSSANGVARTLDKLTSIVEAKGFKVVARVDHAAAAATVGKSLRPTQLLIFGNPKVGTALMSSSQGAALDLPVRVAAWEDEAGKVWISYTAPSALAERYRIGNRDKVIARMSKALEKFTAAAAAP